MVMHHGGGVGLAGMTDEKAEAELRRRPDRRPRQSDQDPAIHAPCADGSALQAMRGAVRGPRRGRAPARRLQAIHRQPVDVHELHHELAGDGGHGRGDRRHAPLRRHPRVDGHRRAHAADRLPRFPGPVLSDRVQGVLETTGSSTSSSATRSSACFSAASRAARMPRPRSTPRSSCSSGAQPDATPNGPIPSGPAVHTGLAYVGATGPAGAVDDFTALGDRSTRRRGSRRRRRRRAARVDWPPRQAAGRGDEPGISTVRGRHEPLDVLVLRPRWLPTRPVRPAGSRRQAPRR